jgi:flagellar motor switch protein FliM
MLRIMPRISSFPPEVKSFDEYVESCDNFVSVTNSRIEELRGNSLLVIEAPFVSHLTNSYYGGSKVQSLFSQSGEFTATEQRIIEIITEGMNASLEAAWKDMLRTKFEVQSREENIQFVSFVDGADTVIVCAFMVQMPNHDPVSFDVVYPLQTLKPISSQLRSRVQNEFAQDDRSWKDRLQNAVLSIPLTLTAEIGNPKTSIGKLMKSSEGDTFAMATPEHVLVKVAGERVFFADIGKVGPNAAISMKKRIMKNGERDG